MTTRQIPPEPRDEPLDPQLALIVDAILDGGRVDWTLSSDGASGTFKQELRIVADVVNLHRSLGSLDDARHASAFPPELPWRTGHLTITQSLGKGAFGEVFRAWDTQLHRDVALKLLFRDRGDTIDAAHFLDEGRLLAKVRHPHVVTVYGAERIDGRVGLVTEFIGGRTLAAIVAEEGPLPAVAVATIGIDLCRALGAVHQAGLLHRDIKAQNVMQEAGGRIVLMDFGAGTFASDAAMTGLAGTPLYLAPELWEGAQPTVGTDVYSLGILMYFLATGTYPVRGKTTAEIRAALRRDERQSVDQVRPGLPRSFVTAVSRAIALDPGDRYSTTAEFEQALLGTIRRRRSVHLFAAAGALLVLLSAGIWQWREPGVAAPAAIGVNGWVLVAAFENKTGDRLLDETIQYGVERELANSPALRIVPSPRVSSTLALMQKPANEVLGVSLARDVALRDGSVDAVVTGRIERFGSRYVVAASIVAPDSGEILSTVSAEAATIGAIPRALKELGYQLRERLGAGLAASQAERLELEAVTTPSLDALQSYTRAVRLGDRNAWGPALELSRTAVQQDPTFAAAHTWLAWSLRNTNTHNVAESLVVAQQAVALASSVTEWERRWILGSYHHMAGERAAAIAHYEALLELRPDHVWAVRNLRSLTNATTYAVRLAELLPNDLFANHSAAATLLIDGGLSAQVEHYRNRAEALLPRESPSTRGPIYAWLRLYPAHARALRGDFGGMEPDVQHALTADDGQDRTGRTLLETAAFHMRIATGNVSGARQVISELHPSDAREMHWALGDLACGDPAAARTRLARIRYDLNDTTMVLARADLLVWLMARTGLVGHAKALLAFIRDYPGGRYAEPELLGAATAIIALAEGREAEAIALLSRHFPRLAAANRPDALAIYYRGALTLAEAYQRQGNMDLAMETLRLAMDGRSGGNPRANAGLFLLGVKIKLADLLRQQGRAGDAAALDDAISRQLAFADEACKSALRGMWASPER